MTAATDLNLTATDECGEPSDLGPLVACGKPANHEGERHTASVFGCGTYTWGYAPTAAEAAR